MPQWLTELGAALKDGGTIAVLIVCAGTAGTMAGEFLKHFRKQKLEKLEAPIVAPPSHAAQTQMLVPAERMTMENLLSAIAQLQETCDRLLLHFEREVKEEEERERDEALLKKLVDRLKPAP